MEALQDVPTEFYFCYDTDAALAFSTLDAEEELDPNELKVAVRLSSDGIASSLRRGKHVAQGCDHYDMTIGNLGAAGM